jgi:RNA polymerase sigma-70 factor (ECF subfamily)
MKSAAEAFGDLYDGSFDVAYGFVFARTGDTGAAEEILQETYAAVWKSLGGFRKNSSGVTWVLAIARRKVADYYRKAIRRERNEAPCMDPEETDAGPDPGGAAVGAETRERVSAALRGLNPAYRYALVMKYLDGRSTREIASALGRTPKAVDGILQRAKADFAKRYGTVSGGKEIDE